MQLNDTLELKAKTKTKADQCLEILRTGPASSGDLDAAIRLIEMENEKSQPFLAGPIADPQSR